MAKACNVVDWVLVAMLPAGVDSMEPEDTFFLQANLFFTLQTAKFFDEWDEKYLVWIEIEVLKSNSLLTTKAYKYY